MNRRITPQTTLDNLKKEAKRWLAALRDDVRDARERFERAHNNAPATPGLRDVQHALAREYGFAGWTALKAAVGDRSAGQSQSERVAKYEQAARDLVAVHDSEDAEALARLRDHYGAELTPADVRANAWDRVYAVRQRAHAGERHLELAEAQELIARDAGFGNWLAFIEATVAGRSAPGRSYDIDRKAKAIRPRRALAADEWEALVGFMKDERVETLDAGGQMTDALLARVAELDHVTRLQLEGSRQLTDDGLRHLVRMPQLRELDLSGCSLSDRALDVLRHLPNLRTFSMRWQNGVTDTGMQHLAACDAIEHVDLMGSHTGDGAIRALTGKPALRRFKSGRMVTDAGLALLDQFPVFGTWQGGVTKLSLMESEPGPNQLLLDGPFTDAGVAGLAGLEGLFGLTFFRHASAITRAALQPLTQLPNLGFLRWDGALADDAALRTIGSMPRLRMLIAQEPVATDEGFIALSRSQTLEYLWGAECPNLTGRGFAALSRMPALRGLGVSCKGVGDDALALLPQFPQLRELMPMDVTDEGFRHVGQCAQLEALWCMYCRETTDEATSHVSRLPGLRLYYAGRTRITDRSLAMLSEMQSLEQLTFWQIKDVSDAGVRLLKKLPRLRELTLEELPHVTADVVAEFPSEVRVTYAP